MRLEVHHGEWRRRDASDPPPLRLRCGVHRWVKPKGRMEPLGKVTFASKRSTSNPPPPWRALNAEFAEVELKAALCARRGWFETHSLPTLTRSYPRRFTFYVALPDGSIVVVTDRKRQQCRSVRGACSLQYVRLTKLPRHMGDVCIVSRLR